MLALYSDLSSLKMTSSESVTDYVIRAETAAASLKAAGEVISDSLLIAMVLKGLTPEFKTFSAIIIHDKDEVSFLKFKADIKCYEETMKSSCSKREAPKPEETVMDVRSSGPASVMCYRCKLPGHKSFECQRSSQTQKTQMRPPKRWCNICKNPFHFSKDCRKRNSLLLLFVQMVLNFQ